jgi:hypothetical protein
MEKNMTPHTVLWRGLYLPGHEACRLVSQNSRWHLMGTAVFAHQQQPCRLDYLVICDANWRTVSGKVSGWVGNTLIDVALTVDPDHRWRLNGAERPEVAGCVDIDLNFSPATNLLPIRRLNLAIGQQAEVRAAWLRFPTFELESLPQLYRRLDESTYRYESRGGQFVADLQVDPAGFVLNYPGIWQAEATGYTC